MSNEHAYALAKETLKRLGYEYDADIQQLAQQIEDTITDFLADMEFNDRDVRESVEEAEERRAEEKRDERARPH